MAKMKTKWVALCSSAIATVYAAGWVITNEDALHALPVIAQPAAISASGHLSDSREPISGSDASATSKYKDGTFIGTGSNRRGSIEVAVTVNNDTISKVEIGNFAMHYAESDIAGLPDEVLAAQSAMVRNVSGATYSTQAFEDAVQDALNQARIER